MAEPAGILLAVDPGIDVAAAAVYDLSRLGRARFLGSLDAGARAFDRIERCRTSPREDTLTRCAALSEWMRGLVAGLAPAAVVIEVPHRPGTYSGKQGRQRGKTALNAAALEKLNRAIGALGAGAYAGAAGNPQRRAPRIVEFRSEYGRAFASKDVRHDALNAAFTLLGMPALRGNADDRDAAFLGAFYIAMEIDR